MPQLDVVSYGPQVLRVVVSMVVLYVGVVQGVLPLVRRMMWVRALKRAKARGRARARARARVGEDGVLRRREVVAAKLNR